MKWNYNLLLLGHFVSRSSLLPPIRLDNIKNNGKRINHYIVHSVQTTLILVLAIANICQVFVTLYLGCQINVYNTNKGNQLVIQSLILIKTIM